MPADPSKTAVESRANMSTKHHNASSTDQVGYQFESTMNASMKTLKRQKREQFTFKILQFLCLQ